MPTAPEPQKPNGVAQVLASLAQSSHAWVQFGTLLLIGLAGLGNWAATWNAASKNRQEIEVSRRVNWEGQERIRSEVIRQVSEIHSWMSQATEEFHKGNADSAANRKLLNQLVRQDLDDFEERQLAALSNQNKIMASQSQILENDTVVIKQIHEIVEKLEALRRIDRMPGAHP